RLWMGSITQRFAKQSFGCIGVAQRRKQENNGGTGRIDGPIQLRSRAGPLVPPFEDRWLGCHFGVPSGYQSAHPGQLQHIPLSCRSSYISNQLSSDSSSLSRRVKKLSTTK